MRVDAARLLARAAADPLVAAQCLATAADLAREVTTAANGRLEGSRSFAMMSGPGAGGILVGAVTAPVAVIINTATYLISAAANPSNKKQKPPPQPDTGPRQPFLVQLGYGLKLVVRNTYLWALGAEAAVYNLSRATLIVSIIAANAACC